MEEEGHKACEGSRCCGTKDHLNKGLTQKYFSPSISSVLSIFSPLYRILNPVAGSGTENAFISHLVCKMTWMSCDESSLENRTNTIYFKVLNVQSSSPVSMMEDFP